MDNADTELPLKGKQAKEASRRLAYLSTEIKNRVLHEIAHGLLEKTPEILAANRQDYDEKRALLDFLKKTRSARKRTSSCCTSMSVKFTSSRSPLAGRMRTGGTMRPRRAVAPGRIVLTGFCRGLLSRLTIRLRASVLPAKAAAPSLTSAAFASPNA